MKYLLQSYEPNAPYRFFEEISAIPRGSHKEKAIADYLVSFAQERGLWYHRDEMNNVYIKKPGTPGCEGLPPVVLQSHTDMVCEKNKDTVHDFEKDPIQLYVENDILRARGTTLGADNGAGMAFTLAVLDSKDVPHPPIEGIFTAMEEVGLNGAYNIDPGLIQGRRMINLDSGKEGSLLVSAAGGRSVAVRLGALWEAPATDSCTLAIQVRGLLGGHSGGDIDKERANANKLMGRILCRLEQAGVPLQVSSISGGMLSNAIPRECDCVLCLPQGQEELLRQTVAAVEEELQGEFADSDPDVRLLVQPAQGERVLSRAVSQKLANLLNLLPNGRLTMSRTIPGLVTLSLNQGVVTTHDDYIQIDYALRSAKKSPLDQLTRDLMQLATLLGAQCQETDGYPTWEYRAESPLRETMKQVYQELRGQEVVIRAVHGGVECGVFTQKIPEMDIVAMGPNLGGAHTPDEWLDLKSFGRTYEYILAVLKKLAGK